MLIRFAKILTQNVLLLREADAAQDRDHARSSGRRSSGGTRPARHAPRRDGPPDGGSERLVGGAGGAGEGGRGSRSSGTSTSSSQGRPGSGRCPSALATLLRERLPYAVHEAGVSRAVELASRDQGQGRHRRAQGRDAARRRAAAHSGNAAGTGPAAPAHPRRALRSRASARPARPEQAGAVGGTAA